MIDRDEDIGAAFLGRDRLAHVCAPDLIDPVGDDGARMRVGIALDRSLRREQVVLVHDPPHPARGGAHALGPQPRPDLAIPLAGKGRGGDHGLGVDQQLGVAARALRPTPLRRTPRIGGPGAICRRTMPVDRRPGHAPDVADAGHPEAAVRGDRMRPAHFFDLRRAKGRPPSSLSIFA
jgi:hypothetical protein